MDRISVKLVGTAPLLMHNGRLADPTDDYAVMLARVTSKRHKTVADHHRIGEIEWKAGLWLRHGRPCLPGVAVESAIVTAAKTRRQGRIARAAVLVPENSLIDHDGPDDIDALFADKRHVHRTGVRVAGRTTMRTRPRFDGWSVIVRIDFLPSMIDEAFLRELLDIAGDRVGVGDFRPRFGRFEVRRV